MLEEKDIERLIEAFEPIFATKEDLRDLATKSDINELLNSVDAYAHKADTYFQEMVMLSHKVDRHERDSATRRKVRREPQSIGC